MCTVSWAHGAAGYRLFCNRDERLSRASAFGPRIQERDGVRFIAPLDGDFGGTWIGANEFGVSMCLLNGAPGTRGARSRGLLVLDLLSVRSIDETAERFETLDLSPYGPFTLAVLEPGRDAAALEWDGRDRNRFPVAPPLVSSSFDPAGVQARRREQFRACIAAGRTMAAFHASHADGPSAYSPCMHRADAETVSFSRVRVTASQVELLYTPAAPCRRGPTQRFHLRRTRCRN